MVDIEQHIMYCGVTQSGKTTLARHHARILDRAGYDTVAYDPVQTGTFGGDWPKDCKILNTPKEFHEYIAKNSGTPERPIYLFVDEAADIFGHSETEAHWIPRKIRHQNIYMRMIVQRPKMVHPNVRTQCTQVYMLRLALDDAKIICADFGHGADIYQQTLDTGDCRLLTSGAQHVEYFNVFSIVPKSPRAASA